MHRRNLIIGGGALAIVGGGVGLSFSQMGSQSDYERALASQRAPLASGRDAREAVRFATLAANGHNTQPWRFRVGEQTIRITPDLSRRTPAVDPDDHHLYVSLGCAAENLSLAANARGLVGETRFEPAGEGAVVFDYRVGAEQRSALCDAIPVRQSTRAEFDGRTVSATDLAQLEQAAATPGVDVVFITERAHMERVRDLVITGNDLQMADRAFMAELKDWMRFNPRAAIEHGDGLFSASSGNPTLPTWLGRPMFDLAFQAKAENEKYARHIASSAGLAVFVGAGAEPAHWIAVGRACQRFALHATVLGLKLAFINQPVEVASLRPELAALVGAAGRRPDLVMRFGYGPTLPMSPRRPVDAVIDA
jgi:Nitroreductase family